MINERPYNPAAWASRKDLEIELSNLNSLSEAQIGLTGDVPAIPITPQMKRSVLYEGQPLFSRGGTGLRENVSKVASNTYTRTDYIDDINKALMGLDDEDSPYTYNVKSEAQSLANAQARIDADLEGEMQTLPNQEVFDGEDTDTAMMIMHEMFEQGNVDEANSGEGYRSWPKDSGVCEVYPDSGRIHRQGRASYRQRTQ